MTYPQTSKRKIGYLIFCLFALFMVACSNSSNELDELGENQVQADNELSIPSTEDDSNLLANENEESFNIDDEMNEEPLVEVDDPTETVENEPHDHSTPQELLQETDPENNADGSLPSEPDQPETPSERSPDNDQDSRPTLRTPVDSADEPRVLTLGLLNLHNENHASFRKDNTQLFEWDYPHVEIEFATVISEDFHPFDPPITDSTEELRKLITGDNPPDVLFLNYPDYRTFMEEGLLVALDPLLVESELSLDDFEPIVADGLVNSQDDQTYGLSPYFTANALMYNKDLFDQMNLPYPRDRMTWEEAFTLAKQMTFIDGDKNVYGLMFANTYRPPMLYDLWRRYIPGLGVTVYDEEAERVSVTNEEWVSIFTSIKDLYDAGVFPSDQSGLFRGNTFYSGTIAMSIMPYSNILTTINDTISVQHGQREPIPNWDIVTVPVHPESPHVGAEVYMEPVIAINANGRNQLDAWRLIESIHSPEWAQHSEETTWYRLSSRKDYAVNLEEVDYNKAALYQLRPPEQQYESARPYFGLDSIHYRKLDQGAYGDMLEGKLGIEEALEKWEYIINNRTIEFQ